MGAACAAGALLIFPLRSVVAATPPNYDINAFDGLQLLRRDRNARLLVLLLAAQFVVIGALDVLYVELAQGVLSLPTSWVGYLAAAFGAGGIVAAIVGATIVGSRRLIVPLGLSLGVWTAALLLLAATAAPATALLLLAMAGGARATFDVVGRTLLQRVAPVNVHGRVFGLLEGLAMAALAVGSFLAPALISIGGASLAFIGVAAILPLAALVAGRRFLAIDQHARVPVVEIALLARCRCSHCFRHRRSSRSRGHSSRSRPKQERTSLCRETPGRRSTPSPTAPWTWFATDLAWPDCRGATASASLPCFTTDRGTRRSPRGATACSTPSRPMSSSRR